jgi:hypothetical protein
MGAHRTVNIEKETLKGIMPELNMVEGFDVGLEMSGVPAAFRDMLEVMNHGGKIAMLGIPPSETAIDWTKVIFKGLTIKGIYGREMYETWYKMIAMLQGGLDLSPMITHRFDVKDYLEGFRTIGSRKSGKVVLDGSVSAGVNVVVGPGSIRPADCPPCQRSKHVVLADVQKAAAAAKTLSDAGFEVTTATVDISSGVGPGARPKAASLGPIVGLIHAAGGGACRLLPRPSSCRPYGTAVLLEDPAPIAQVEAAVVISSQSGHRLPALTPERNKAPAHARGRPVGASHAPARQR